MEKWYLLKNIDNFNPAINMAIEEVIAQEVDPSSILTR